MMLPWTISCEIFIPAAPHSSPSIFYITVNQSPGRRLVVLKVPWLRCCVKETHLCKKTATHLSCDSCECDNSPAGTQTHLFPCFHPGLMSVWIPYRWHDTQKLQNDRVLMLLGSLRMRHAFSIHQQRTEGSPGPGFMTLVGFHYSTTT